MIADISNFLVSILNIKPKLQVPSNPEKGFLCFNCGPYRTSKESPIEVALKFSKEINENLDQNSFILNAVPEGSFVNLKLNVQHFLFSFSLENFLQTKDPKKIIIEFSSPNTNKPQHLGHVRNNILGQTISNILKASGHNVLNFNLINDRGIHIMKSLLAYKKWGSADLNKKGDHIIGDCYVRFNEELKKEYSEFKSSTGEHISEEEFFNKYSNLGKETRELLLSWERSDPEVVTLWRKLNDMVITGFDETYARLGIQFDHVEYESDTYLLGKKAVQEGLEKGIFYYKDGAVVFDQTSLGFGGEKVILRSDGTSLYITQDLGTALNRLDTYDPDFMYYVVGDEQNHYFKTLIAIIEMLRPNSKGKMHHISYGMVELPNGKMKSREGNVVDADNLMDEMKLLASYKSKNSEQNDSIGISALKFYLMDNHPTSKIIFDSDKSLDLTGRSGVYVLYTYARCSKLLSKTKHLCVDHVNYKLLTHSTELKLVQQLALFETYFNWAVENKDPSKITEYLYKLSKNISWFYESSPILSEKNLELASARFELVSKSCHTLKVCLDMLGCETLDAM